jgi:hypothetical protein
MDRGCPRSVVAPYPVRHNLDCPQRETLAMTARAVTAGPASQLFLVAPQEMTAGRPSDREGTERAAFAPG